MSSKRKLDSARANGKKSHGPVTEQGRKHSSMNALKYGLCAQTVVLPNESEDEYAVLLDSYIQDLQPSSSVEMDLITDMVNAKWRQRRLYNVETDLYRQEMDKHKEAIEKSHISYNENVEHAFAFRSMSQSGSLAMLSRFESQLERAYSRALHNLLRLRAVRESNRDKVNKDSENRTQSQERTPIANLTPQTQYVCTPPAPPSVELTEPVSPTPWSAADALVGPPALDRKRP